ncbi:hypothetical protein BRD00_07935 [Halobacteriales archaeon QS_8_69_26]|nr:MAG: hypothetical protein BRD00_07935 [Halobacteriales archaeon QS_8_69_26]
METFTHALRLNDLGDAPRGSAPAIDSFDPRDRKVLRAAVEEGYSTDDPPDWLRKLVSGTGFFAADGRHYELDHTLPTTRITAEEVSEEAVDGDVASNAAYREAVDYEGRVMTGLLRIAERDGIEFVYVWPSLREFLDAHEAVRYRGRVLEVSVSREDPGAPYTVEATPASLSDLADGPVWDASDADPELRRVVRRAGETTGLYPLDDPPEGLLERLDAHDHVYLDGTFYTTYVEKRGPLPVRVEASFTDPDGDPARIEIALHNESDGTVGVSSGAPPPFGVLRFGPEGSDGPWYLLWTDAYEESTHVHTEGREVTSVNSIAVGTEVDPDDSVSRTFEVEGSDPSNGTYVVESDVGVSLPGDDGGTFPYRIVFEAS